MTATASPLAAISEPETVAVSTLVHAARLAAATTATNAFFIVVFLREAWKRLAGCAPLKRAKFVVDGSRQVKESIGGLSNLRERKCEETGSGCMSCCSR